MHREHGAAHRFGDPPGPVAQIVTVAAARRLLLGSEVGDQKIDAGALDILPRTSGIIRIGDSFDGLFVHRFDGVKGRYSLFSGECDSTDGPFNQGTYVYVKMPDWGAWEEKFIYGPYIHHVSCAYASLTPVLREAVRFIDGLEFDPIGGGASCR